MQWLPLGLSFLSLDHLKLIPSSPQILKQAQRAEFIPNFGAPESVISAEFQTTLTILLMYFFAGVFSSHPLYDQTQGSGAVLTFPYFYR
jgi:hypothetical protein